MPDLSPAKGRPLPALMPVANLQKRLQSIFPAEFPDRAMLTGVLAARVVYVFLYGGFVQGAERYLRPSHIYLFTAEQAGKTSAAERENWGAQSPRSGFRPPGIRWYADNSRESIRDDLMRNKLFRYGIAHKLSGVPVTSSKPVWSLDEAFAALFDQVLHGRELADAIAAWRDSSLDNETLQRMALRAAGIERQTGDVFVELPDGTRTRMSAGPSSLITKGLIEGFAAKHLAQPAVLWISASDKKAVPHFVELAARVGLHFDLNAALPDVILADLRKPIRYFLCEVVATDGPMTEGRRADLVALIRSTSSIAESSLVFLTAYEDRGSPALKKNFSQFSIGSYIWFRTEPDLLVHLSKLAGGIEGLRST